MATKRQATTTTTDNERTYEARCERCRELLATVIIHQAARVHANAIEALNPRNLYAGHRCAQISEPTGPVQYFPYNPAPSTDDDGSVPVAR